VTLASYAVTHGRYTEIVVPGKPLGRHVMADSRSAAYPFRAAASREVTDTDWQRHLVILDQGDLGSCEGNAELGCAASGPVWDALPATLKRLVGSGEREAVALYSAATSLDGFPGSYPPTDTGTDSTSVSKAALREGLISGYTHAAAVDDVLQAVMGGPVNLGIPWYEGFDDPGIDGLVSIAGAVRGGHALCCRGIDAGRKRVWLDNSWGASWGKAGRCCMTWDTLDALLADDGECVVPVPLSAPPPEPQPVPADPLPAYLADRRLVAWSGARHVLENRYAARAFAALRAAEGQ
jgi:hypothetical protein